MPSRNDLLSVVLRQLLDQHVAVQKASPYRARNVFILIVLGYFTFGSALACLALTVLTLTGAARDAGALIGTVVNGVVAVLAAVGLSYRVRSQRQSLANAQAQRVNYIDQILACFPEVHQWLGGHAMLESPYAVRWLIAAPSLNEIVISRDATCDKPPIACALSPRPTKEKKIVPAGLRPAGPSASADDDWNDPPNPVQLVVELWQSAGRYPLAWFVGAIITLVAVNIAAMQYNRWHAVTPDRRIVVLSEGDESSCRVYLDHKYFFFSTDVIAVIAAQDNPRGELRITVPPTAPDASLSRDYRDVKFAATAGPGVYTVTIIAKTFHGRSAATDVTVHVLPRPEPVR